MDNILELATVQALDRARETVSLLETRNKYRDDAAHLADVEGRILDAARDQGQPSRCASARRTARGRHVGGDRPAVRTATAAGRFFVPLPESRASSI